MHSNTKKYSPLKILAILFSLLLVIEIAINYFSSSSIHFLRFHEDESVDTNNTERIAINGNKDQFVNSNQLDFYASSIKYATSTSILSYINDNCDYCINTKYFEDYYRKYCPYQLSDLKQDDYCQYLYVKLINEYSFSTLLSSIITLISGKMNSLKLTINNQRRALPPSNSKCYRIQRQIPRYSASYHTQKSSAPQKGSSLHSYTSPKDKIKMRTHNFNLMYRRIGETQEYLGDHFENITILTAKNLICINTRSKEPLTIDFRTLLLNASTNQSKDRDDLKALKSKDQRLASSGDIPKTKNKTNDSSNLSSKLSVILHLLFSGSTTNWVVNLIMTLIKGSLILYLINIVKINENKKNKSENGKNRNKNKDKKLHQNRITDDSQEGSKKLSKSTKDQKVKKVRSRKGEKKNIHKLNSNNLGKYSTKRMSIKSLRDFVNATKTATSTNSEITIKSKDSDLNDVNKNHIKPDENSLKSTTPRSNKITKIFSINIAQNIHSVMNFISPILTLPSSLPSFSKKRNKTTSRDISLVSNKNLKESNSNEKSEVLPSRDQNDDIKIKEEQLNDNKIKKNNSIKVKDSSTESNKKQKQKSKLNKNQNVKSVEQPTEKENNNTLEEEENTNFDNEIQKEYEYENNMKLSQDKKSLHDSGIFIPKTNILPITEKIQKSKSDPKLKNDTKNKENISKPDSNSIKNDKEKLVDKSTFNISNISVTSSINKSMSSIKSEESDMAKEQQNNSLIKKPTKSTKVSKKDKKNKKETITSEPLKENKINPLPTSTTSTSPTISTHNPTLTPTPTTSIKITTIPINNNRRNSFSNNATKGLEKETLKHKKSMDDIKSNLNNKSNGVKDKELQESNNLNISGNKSHTYMLNEKNDSIININEEENKIEYINRDVILDDIENSKDCKIHDDYNSSHVEKHNLKILKEINTKGLNKLDNLIKNIITNKNHHHYQKLDDESEVLLDKDTKDENITENITLNYSEQDYNDNDYENDQIEATQLNGVIEETMSSSSSGGSIDSLNKYLKNIIDNKFNINEYSPQKDIVNNNVDNDVSEENKKLKKIISKSESLLNGKVLSTELSNKKAKYLKFLMSKNEKKNKESKNSETSVGDKSYNKKHKKDKNNKTNLNKTVSNDSFNSSSKKKKKKDNIKLNENVKTKGHKHTPSTISNSSIYSSSPPNHRNSNGHKKSCSISTRGSVNSIENYNNKYNNVTDTIPWPQSPGNIGRSQSFNNSLLGSETSDSDISFETFHKKYPSTKSNPLINNNLMMDNNNDILSMSLASFNTPSRSSSYKSNKSNKSWNDEHQPFHVPSRIDSVHNFLTKSNLPSFYANGIEDLTNYLFNNNSNNKNNNNNNITKNQTSGNSTPDINYSNSSLLNELMNHENKNAPNSNYISSNKNQKLAAIDANNKNQGISNYYFMMNNSYPTSTNSIRTPPGQMSSLNDTSLYAATAANYRNSLNYSNVSLLSNSSKNYDYELLKEFSLLNQNSMSSVPLNNSSLNDAESLKDTFNYDLKDIDLDQESVLSFNNEEEDKQDEKISNKDKDIEDKIIDDNTIDHDNEDNKSKNDNKDDEKIVESKNKTEKEDEFSLFNSLLDKAQNKSTDKNISGEMTKENENNMNGDDNKNSSFKLKPHPPLMMEQKTPEQEAKNSYSTMENVELLRYSRTYPYSSSLPSSSNYNPFSNNVYSPFNTGFSFNYRNNPFASKTMDTTNSNSNVNYASSIQRSCSLPSNSYQQPSEKNSLFEKENPEMKNILEENKKKENDIIEKKEKDNENDNESKESNKNTKDQVLNDQINQWIGSYSQNQVDQYFNNSFNNFNNFNFNPLSTPSNTTTTSLSSTATSTATTRMSSNLFNTTRYSNPTMGYSSIGLPPTQPQSSQSLTSSSTTKTSNTITPIGKSSSTTSEINPLSFLSMNSSFLTTPQTSSLSPWNNSFGGFSHPSNSTINSSSTLTSPFVSTTESLLQPNTLSRNYSNTPSPSCIGMPSYSIHGLSTFNGVLNQVNTNGQNQMNSSSIATTDADTATATISLKVNNINDHDVNNVTEKINDDKKHEEKE